MELERDATPEEEFNESHREVANLFEETVLLTAQTYNSLAYQRRMNISVVFNAYPKFQKSKGNSKETAIRIRWNRK